MTIIDKKLNPILHQKIKKAIFEDETHSLIVRNRLVGKGMDKTEATEAVNHVLRVEKENFRKKSTLNMILGALAILLFVPYYLFLQLLVANGTLRPRGWIFWSTIGLMFFGIHRLTLGYKYSRLKNKFSKNKNVKD